MFELIRKTMALPDKLGKFTQSSLLLVLRVIIGWLLFESGSGKFGNIEGVIGFFTHLGIPAPEFQAYFVAFVESVGGLLLMAGVLSRIVAIPLSITMFVALFTAHSKELGEGLSSIVGSSPFPYLIVLLIVIVFGPGKFAVDAWVKKVILKSIRE